MSSSNETLRPASAAVYNFADFRLDEANRLLTRAEKQGETPARQINLPARSFDCLVMLLRHHGQLVTKTEMMDTVWSGSFVEESNLTVAISTLRRALDEDPVERKYIQTVSGRGYRFIHPLTLSEPEPISENTENKPPQNQVQAPARSPYNSIRIAIGFAVIVCVLAAAIVFQVRYRHHASAQPANAQAKELYEKGRYAWNLRTEEGVQQSIDFFKQSINADPNYALAYAGLADSYALLSSFSVESGRTVNPDARTAALSAIQLDPTLAEPHASLGMIYFFTDWDGPKAEQEFQRAIALNPDYATAHHWYALDLAAMGRFPQALNEIHRAQQLDPMSLIIATNVGWVEYLGRDNAGAMRDLDKVLQLDPNFVRALTRRGILEIQLNNPAAAVTDLTRASQLSNDPYILGLLGESQALGGDQASAKQTLAQLQTLSKTKYVPPFAFALIDLGLGKRDDALKALQQSVEDHTTSMVYAKVDPSLDAIRSMPQFQSLVASMHF